MFRRKPLDKWSPKRIEEQIVDSYVSSDEAKNGAWPTNDEIAAAMEGLEFDTPRGRVLVRKDHEAVHEAMWGVASGKKHPTFGFPMLDQFRVFPASDVTPPEGKKTVEWIESWPTRR